MAELVTRGVLKEPSLMAQLLAHTPEFQEFTATNSPEEALTKITIQEVIADDFNIPGAHIQQTADRSRSKYSTGMYKTSATLAEVEFAVQIPAEKRKYQKALAYIQEEVGVILRGIERTQNTGNVNGYALLAIDRWELLDGPALTNQGEEDEETDQEFNEQDDPAPDDELAPDVYGFMRVAFSRGT